MNFNNTIFTFVNKIYFLKSTLLQRKVYTNQVNQRKVYTIKKWIQNLEKSLKKVILILENSWK